MYSVHCKSEDQERFRGAYAYAVEEDRDGNLRWEFFPGTAMVSVGLPLDGTELVLPRCGYMVFTPVTEEEAMLITGLTLGAAALDKLRDLVHEARERTPA